MVLVMIVFLIVLISYGNVKDEGMTIVGIGTSKVGGVEFGKFAKLNVNLNNAYFFNDTFTHLFSLNYSTSYQWIYIR